MTGAPPIRGLRGTAVRAPKAVASFPVVRIEVVLDTSWLLELYRIPGHFHDSRSREAISEMLASIESGYAIWVTVPVVFEVANHISHVKDGSRRRQLSLKLLKDIKSSDEQGVPWTIHSVDKGILLRSFAILPLIAYSLSGCQTLKDNCQFISRTVPILLPDGRIIMEQRVEWTCRFPVPSPPRPTPPDRNLGASLSQFKVPTSGSFYGCHLSARHGIYRCRRTRSRIYSGLRMKKTGEVCRFFVGILIFCVAGCVHTDKGSVHVYQPPESESDREFVSYPVDPDNSNWIARTCEGGHFSYSHKDREFTPYGVVFRVIECLPPNQASDPEAASSPHAIRFEYTGDPENLPTEIRAELETGSEDTD